jgi:hypothetical protein
MRAIQCRSFGFRVIRDRILLPNLPAPHDHDKGKADEEYSGLAAQLVAHLPWTHKNLLQTLFFFSRLHEKTITWGVRFSLKQISIR